MTTEPIRVLFGDGRWGLVLWQCKPNEERPAVPVRVDAEKGLDAVIPVIQSAAGRCLRATSIRVRPNALGCPSCRAELRVGGALVGTLPEHWRSEGPRDGPLPLCFHEWTVHKVGPCACAGECLDVEAEGVDGTAEDGMGTCLGRDIEYWQQMAAVRA